MGAKNKRASSDWTAGVLHSHLRLVTRVVTQVLHQACQGSSGSPSLSPSQRRSGLWTCGFDHSAARKARWLHAHHPGPWLPSANDGLVRGILIFAWTASVLPTFFSSPALTFSPGSLSPPRPHQRVLAAERPRHAVGALVCSLQLHHAARTAHASGSPVGGLR